MCDCVACDCVVFKLCFVVFVLHLCCTFVALYLRFVCVRVAFGVVCVVFIMCSCFFVNIVLRLYCVCVIIVVSCFLFVVYKMCVLVVPLYSKMVTT